MNMDRLKLEILYYLDAGFAFEASNFDLEPSALNGLLHKMLDDDLIIREIPVDLSAENINNQLMKITSKGSEFLKQINSEIQKNILEVLKENQFTGGLTSSKISRQLFIHLRHKEMEAYLKVLNDKSLIKIDKKRIHVYKSPDKKINIPASTHEEFRISENGLIFLETGYEKLIFNKRKFKSGKLKERYNHHESEIKK